MSTNYFDTFIAIAPDCPVARAEIPPEMTAKPTVAALQFELLGERPYELTSDDVLFEVYARRSNVDPADMEAERERFFAKDQACLRASPLGKRYGWGTHHNKDGRVALYAVESEDYRRLASLAELTQKVAMRSSRK